MERFIDWCKGLTMEQMFVLTGIGVLVLGIGLGLLIGQGLGSGFVCCVLGLVLMVAGVLMCRKK